MSAGQQILLRRLLNRISTNHHNYSTSNLRRYSLLFLGAPGVGKGTFGKLIAPKFNAQLMTSSDLLRDVADNLLKNGQMNDKLNGEYIKECIRTGKLVSDDIVIPIVIDFLRNVQGSFIFDGFPRTLNQVCSTCFFHQL